ncbi:MAG: YopX family protein [Intestinibacter sp.]|uniref:YopX family protein n=1 Tax=Intestinibacter sp. TaxID=1965304 RepID=UPI002A83A9B5|nr:YopX family protein [Intestinibacter sp.]MDY4574261.1 YopX family protein [Intestinibacter sp.]
MNRDIKFRAWDIANKRMLQYRDIMSLPMWEVFSGTPEQRPYQVMQYTGIKDKDGVEIYEEDIVRIDDEEELRKVEWDSNNAEFTLTMDFVTTDFDCLYPRQIEVVGNIYENPELI